MDKGGVSLQHFPGLRSETNLKIRKKEALYELKKEKIKHTKPGKTNLHDDRLFSSNSYFSSNSSSRLPIQLVQLQLHFWKPSKYSFSYRHFHLKIFTARPAAI